MQNNIFLIRNNILKKNNETTQLNNNNETTQLNNNNETTQLNNNNETTQLNNNNENETNNIYLKKAITQLNNNNNNIKNNDNNNEITTKKYNPDVLQKFNDLKRPNEFQLKNDFYKPITNNMTENIITSDDLIIFKGAEKDKNLVDKYNQLNNERNKENEICLEMQKKFKNMKIMMVEKEQGNDDLNSNQDNEINSFVELKMNVKEIKQQYNKLDNILSRLKDLNIDI
jgi:hypothetical protein